MGGTLVCVVAAVLWIRRRRSRDGRSHEGRWLLVALACTGAAAQAGCAGRQRKIPDGYWKNEARLKCTLDAPATVSVGAPVELTFTLANVSAQPMYVLKWGTPFDGLEANCVKVNRSGEDVPYQGFSVSPGKNVKPGPDSYVRIEPGQSATAKLDLGASVASPDRAGRATAYAMSQPGEYEIATCNRLHDAYARPEERSEDFGWRTVFINCKPVRVRVVGDHPR